MYVNRNHKLTDYGLVSCFRALAPKPKRGSSYPFHSRAAYGCMWPLGGWPWILSYKTKAQSWFPLHDRSSPHAKGQRCPWFDIASSSPHHASCKEDTYSLLLISIRACMHACKKSLQLATVRHLSSASLTLRKIKPNLGWGGWKLGYEGIFKVDVHFALYVWTGRSKHLQAFNMGVRIGSDQFGCSKSPVRPQIEGRFRGV